MAVAVLGERVDKRANNGQHSKERLVMADGRLRVYDRATQHLVYVRWEDMTPEQQAWYRRKWPNFSPDDPDTPGAPASDTVLLRQEIENLKRQLAGLGSPTYLDPVQRGIDVGSASEYRSPTLVNRYAESIERYQRHIEMLETIVREPRETPDARNRAVNDIRQFQTAIEVLNEAAEIPEYDQETQLPGSHVWFVTRYGEFAVQIPPV